MGQFLALENRAFLIGFRTFEPILPLAIAFFVWNIIRSLRKGKPAGDDPWDAWTLEWTTTSPPPPWNYDVDPEVRSRRPLWDTKHPEDPDWKYE